jgi:hypothetical protein
VVVDVFRVFAGEPVACTSEIFLFEWGVFRFSGERLIHLSLVRQLRTESAMSLDGALWQVHCAARANGIVC